MGGVGKGVKSLYLIWVLKSFLKLGGKLGGRCFREKNVCVKL